MKGTLQIILIGIAMTAVILSGCSLIQPPAVTTEQINEELAELQALIPILEAGLAVATANDVNLATASMLGSRAAIKTINAGVVLDGETPRVLFTNGTADGTGWVRFPATDDSFIENFYGTEGNQAEFYLKPFGTDTASTATLFQVRLYIYPTFSTTVNYVLEEYLVAGDDTAWALVDETATATPLYYLTNRTVYFDGMVQEHDVVSNSVSNGLYYDTLFDDSENSAYLDSTSSLYDFPADAGNSTGPVGAAGVANAMYSAKVVSEIAESGVTVVEYYTEIDDGTGEVTKSATSYVLKERVSGKLSETSKTVRRYIEHPDGSKTVRARTESSVSFDRNASSTTSITEAITIVPDTGAGLAEFTSITTSTSGATQIYSTSVTLAETAIDSGSYDGVSTHTTESGTESYTVTLENPASGSGSMTVGGESTSVFYPVSRRTAKDIVAELRNGGSFTGTLKGNIIAGIYKALRSDDASSIEAALSHIYAVTGNTVQLQ